LSAPNRIRRKLSGSIQRCWNSSAAACARSIPFPDAYLLFLIDVIEVEDAQIRIKGNKDSKERSWPAGIELFQVRRSVLSGAQGRVVPRPI
jgi:hypothetical protein